MPSAFTLEVDAQGIGTITFDLPGESVNKLSIALIDEVDALLKRVDEDRAIRAVVLRSGKPDVFLVGADLNDLGRLTKAAEVEDLSRRAQRIMDRFENARAPVVAAIHGTCVGGGLELALACAYRVISDSPRTVLALPEIKLGLLPAAGGCQRMPRTVGLENALDLILAGKNVYPRKALKIGLADEVVPKECLLTVARAAAQKLAAGVIARRREPRGSKLRRLVLELNPLGRGFMYRAARAGVLAKTHGLYPAPLAALEAIRAGIEQGERIGYDTEARLFGELVGGSQRHISHNLIDLFFAMQGTKKDGAAGGGAAPRPVKKVCVLGAGFMGAGIAIVSAQAGATVRLRDRDLPSVGRGLKVCHEHFAGEAKRGVLSRYDAQQRMNLISGTADYSGFRQCDLVIEAVFEDLVLKRRVLAEAEAATPDHCVFASNTSSLPISDIGAGARRPENVIGMHFFSPVPKMPLLEIIVTPKTSAAATATCAEFGRRIGKTVIVVRDAPGFYTSRILAAMLREAAFLLADGAAIEDMDAAMVRFGFPVGPITLLDEVGIDVGVKVAKILHAAFGERMGFPNGLEKVAEAGRLGRKNKSGFYLYTSRKKKQVDPTVYDLLPHGRTRKPYFAPEIQDRLALAFANESVLCLEEGVLQSARDGDLGAILGLGFPPFLGGPFRWLDSLPRGEAAAALEYLAGKFGPRFKPAPMLADMSRTGQKFYR